MNNHAFSAAWRAITHHCLRIMGHRLFETYPKEIRDRLTNFKCAADNYAKYPSAGVVAWRNQALEMLQSSLKEFNRRQELLKGINETFNFGGGGS